MSAVIQLQAVAKSYSKRGPISQALQPLTLTLNSGQTLALLGHNGAGKSTLIKLILGLIEPSAGEVFILGKSPRKQSHLMGYLPENVSFYEQMTGRELLSYFCRLKGVSTTQVMPLLEEYGLQQAADKQLKHYSKGMRQRLGLAQATLGQPKLIVLDEPTVGLDPMASRFLYDKIAQLKAQGCAVVICTHELHLVADEFDQALIMAQGQVLAKGTMAQLQQQAGFGADASLAMIFHALMQPFAQLSCTSISLKEELCHLYD